MITDVTDIRQDARDAYLQSVAVGMPLTGKALGSMYERSERWGRAIIAEVRQTMPGNGTPPEPDPAPDTAAETEPPAPEEPAEDHSTAETGTVAAADDPAVEEVEPEAAAAPQDATVGGSRRIAQWSVCVVAAVAAVVSYAHMYELAVQAGEGWRSWLLPLSVDGLLVVAGMSMYRSRAVGERPTPLAWASLLLGLAASLAANVAVAGPTWTERLVAAWPPVALALAFELLLSNPGQPSSRKTACAQCRTHGQ